MGTPRSALGPRLGSVAEGMEVRNQDSKAALDCDRSWRDHYGPNGCDICRVESVYDLTDEGRRATVSIGDVFTERG